MVLAAMHNNKSRLRWRDCPIHYSPVTQPCSEDKAKEFSKNVRDTDPTVIRWIFTVTVSLIKCSHDRVRELGAVRNSPTLDNSIK